MLERVTLHDRSWEVLCRQWERICEDFGETFDEYAPSSFPVLDTLAKGSQMAKSGVFAVKDGDDYTAACQVNVTLLPAYEGYVLRVRNICFSPAFDFSNEIDINDYSRALVRVFAGVVMLSETAMPSRHIKFHLRSPAELQFGGMFTDVLSEHSAFEKVEMCGAWIYLSKPKSWEP